MEDRYEVKEKIGQGGLGAVYRAYDVRMSREVAVKRIIADSDDNSISKEATRQLIKEASSLASLQHPNIVTIYDVGSDDDGPFVVMELLSGNTLEEIIGQAPLRGRTSGNWRCTPSRLSLPHRHCTSSTAT